MALQSGDQLLEARHRRFRCLPMGPRFLDRVDCLAATGWRTWKTWRTAGARLFPHHRSRKLHPMHNPSPRACSAARAHIPSARDFSNARTPSTARQGLAGQDQGAVPVHVHSPDPHRAGLVGDPRLEPNLQPWWTRRSGRPTAFLDRLRSVTAHRPRFRMLIPWSPAIRERCVHHRSVMAHADGVDTATANGGLQGI